MDPGLSDAVFLPGVSEAEADVVAALNLAALLAEALVALVHVFLAHSHWLVGHRVSAAGVGGAGHLARGGIAGAGVAARISGFGERLASSVLDSIVCAFAVDAVVGNHVTSVLRAGESGAAICCSHDFTDSNHPSLVGAPTGHVLAIDLTGFQARALLAWIVVDFGADLDFFPVVSAGTRVLRASDLTVLVAHTIVASVAGRELLTDSVRLTISAAFTDFVGARHLHVGATSASVATVGGRDRLSWLESLVVEDAFAGVVGARDLAVLVADASVAFHVE